MAIYDGNIKESEYVDPSLRAAVDNIAKSAIDSESNPELAISRGQLKIKDIPRYSYGSALSDAIMNRARAKFNDPETSAELQKLRYVGNQAEKYQNAANQVMGIYKLDRQVQANIRERKAAEDAQRVAVISSVLGLGGAIVGGIYGGPAGAAGGAAAGQAAGGAAAK